MKIKISNFLYLNGQSIEIVNYRKSCCDSECTLEFQKRDFLVILPALRSDGYIYLTVRICRLYTVFVIAGNPYCRQTKLFHFVCLWSYGQSLGANIVKHIYFYLSFYYTDRLHAHCCLFDHQFSEFLTVVIQIHKDFGSKIYFFIILHMNQLPDFFYYKDGLGK